MKKSALFILFFLVANLACATVSKRTASRAAKLEQELYTQLEAGLKSYSAGEFEASASIFDRLIERAASIDSQLVYLGVYFGIRSRLAAGSQSSADSLYDETAHLVPQQQRAELELVLGRLKVTGKKFVGPQEVLATADKLGVVLPLSGQFSEFGQAILEGIELAVKEFNSERVPQNQLKLEVRDDASDPIRAAVLGRALAADSSVAALIGSYEDETSLAVALVASATGVPFICPTAQAPGLDNLGPMVHVLNRTDPELAWKLARFAVKKQNLHTFGVLALDDERGNLLARSFIRGVREAGGVVLSDQRYSSQTSTFENQMNLLRRYLPDAIYLPARSNEITQLTSQVHYFGLGQARLLGTEYWNSERVIRLGGKYVDGAIFAAPFFENGEQLRWHDFKELYERTYHRPVNRYSAFGYDAASLILKAAGGLPTERGLLARNLNNTTDHRGVMGIYTIDESGVVKRKAFILELKEGIVVPARGELAQEQQLESAPTESSATSASPNPRQD